MSLFDLPKLGDKTGAQLNPYNRAVFYIGTEKGYTDYSLLKESAA